MSVFFVLAGLSASWLDPGPMRTCSQTWGQTCNTGPGGNDDAFDVGVACSGSQVGSAEAVFEEYINQTYALFGQTIEATCEFKAWSYAGDREQIWYYNGSGWSRLGIFMPACSGCIENRTVKFKVNSTEGTHIIRCIIDYNWEDDYCADAGTYYDNDDVNFTAVMPLYNITPIVLSVPEGSNVARAQNITASVLWNKNLVSANISHNGASSGFYEYRILPPFTGNMTNYTLYLANTTEFSHLGLINVSGIRAFDTYGQDTWVWSWPMNYFYLWSSAKVSDGALSKNIAFNGSTVDFWCRILDNYTMAPVQNYNVSFFRNGTYFGSQLTNSSGIALISSGTGPASPPVNLTYKCNITNMSSLYYASSSEKSTVLEVVDLGVSIYSISDVPFGSSVTIRANITGNATLIEWVSGKVRYRNVTSGMDEEEWVSLYPAATYSATKTEYSGNYTTRMAGIHNVTVNSSARADPPLTERYAWNTTSFGIGGGANITGISLSKNFIYNGTTATLGCKVANNVSGAPIPDYNVSFFNSSSYIGTSRTNSSGWANITYSDSTPNPPKNISLKCNITNIPELYYNASSEKNTTLYVVDIRANLMAVGDASFGSNITIRANITGNASYVSPVGAQIVFYNYTANNYSAEDIALSPVAVYSPTETEYLATYKVKYSGRYNLTLYAYAERSAYNSTAFNVSYGTPSMSFVFPNFRILANQSFNFSVNVTSTNGDMVNPAFVLSFTNETMMNVSSSESFSKPFVSNITNGSVTRVIWNVSTRELGLVRAYVNATLEKGQNATYDSAYSVLAPIASVLNSSINITRNETLVVKIVGNTSAIQAVNFTVEKPYSGGSDFVIGTFTGSQTESNCVGLGEGAGNIAYGANTSCNVGNCSASVDNRTDTPWVTYTLNSWFTINLSKPYDVDTIEIIWQGGATNTSMFYRSSSGAALESAESSGWKAVQSFQYKDAPEAATNVTVKETSPFRADTLLINDSTAGGLNIYEVRIYSVEGRVDKCYVFQANYTNMTSSGTHEVTSDVDTGSSAGPILHNTSFFVNFGIPQISSSSFETYPSVNSGHIYAYDITAEDGDLRNINATLSISNITIMNFSAGESASKEIAYIAYKAKNTTAWNLTAGPVGGESTNISVFANSSSGLGGSGYLSGNVTVIYADSQAPVIHWFTLSKSMTNLRQSVVVTVNASDNIQVRNVTAQITTPSLSSFNQTNFSQSDWKAEGLWTISIDPGYLDQEGMYSVSVYATDLSANTTANDTLQNFTAYSAYNVSAGTNYSAYNRGEEIVFSVYDVNGNAVSGAYWTVNESYNDGNVTTNETTVFNGTNDVYVYSFAENKTPGIYYLNISVNDSGNSGNYSREISLSSSLNIVFMQPPGEHTYTAGSSISNPRVKLAVRNARNVSIANLTTGGGSVYLVCPGNNLPLSLIYEYDYYYGGDTYTTQADYPCTVSSSYGVDFYLLANATDAHNNSGSRSSSALHTYGSGNNNNPGGGGSNTGASSPGPITLPQQNASRTVFERPKVYSFNFLIDTTDISIIQGKESTLFASAANNGDFNLALEMRASNSPLSLEYSKNISISRGADIDFPIKIRANLSTPPNTYLLTLYLSGHGLEKSRTLKLTVMENPDLYEISALLSDMSALKKKLPEYVALGIDVSRVQKRISSAEAYLSSAEKAYSEGKASVLSESVQSARKEINSANAELGLYKTKKVFLQNRYQLAGWLLAIIAMLFVFGVFIIPYTNISQRLYALRREEKILTDARKASEMQYFMRKINDATFQKIMTDEQDKIYKIRSEAKKLEEELSLLKRLKFRELSRRKNEWKARMKETEKANLVRALHDAMPDGITAGIARRKEGIFTRAFKIVSGFFRKKP